MAQTDSSMSSPIESSPGKTRADDQIIGLADALKRSTADHHLRAEKTGIIAKILTQKATLPEYARYLRNLLPIYQALEKPIADNRSLESLSPLLDKSLRRVGSLVLDLDEIVGRDNWRKMPIVPATDQYVAHINNIRDTSPHALAGHIYVRYLGDLNGGRVLRTLLTKQFSLDESALNFYRFAEIENLKTYRTEYRSNINVLAATPAERSEIIAVAIQGFQYNIDLSTTIACQGADEK